MVQRVNFIKKGAMALTYRNMMLFAGAVCVVCILFHGVFLMWHALLKSRLSETQKQIKELTIQKEKAMLAMQIAQTQAASPSASLASLFVKMPAWSVVFSEMADKMPDQMWLTSIRSSNIGETGQSRKLEINGLSVSHSSIAQFVKQLEDSKSFSNTLLVSTLKDNNLYKFVINSDVDFPEAKW